MVVPIRTGLLRQAATCLRQNRATPVRTLSRDAAIRRLASTLAILEQRDGKLNMSSLASVTAAMKMGGSVHGFLAGSNIKAVADEAAKVEGLEKIIYVENGDYDRGLAENWAPLLVENIKKGGYTHVMAGHSAFGKGLLPRVAAMMDVQQISDITEIQGEDTFVRPIYAGNAILTVQSADNPKIVTVRGTAFASGAAEGGSASTEEGTDPKAECPTQWVSEDLAKSDRPELASAEKVVSGGRGLKSKEEFDRLMPPLADALGAAIGASRAAVDSGFADNSLQVGQTGKNVAPQLYLCAGISGAIQHLAGMKDSKVIAAINKDPDAPIFQVADVGLVGDLFEKVPELTEKLNSA
ncbi:probable electron transfer flavoprotein alpha chain precursor [Ramularia collo-cygni]|uniref:Probable electron transfer flavoprotein subunit alpha n=1 Tax=Ramularia collo-cygni TaxID=112498 RepID=A0A2D3UZI5_9PEZI|nr:probable electron transfer flavoprotein alpha chain precursor [Ramularia collo-cygni]CZT19855.1 probable electron transfer flavoprotein alpha chain precursor [Ramularia collo-cygni]